jgi:hypothetical protein
MGKQQYQVEPVGPARLVALADGVFAIVMTLLVFELGVPLASGVHIDRDLRYGVNIFLVQALCWSLWLYATGNLRLVSRDLDPNLVKGGRLMGVFYCLLILAGIVFAFIRPTVSFLIYGFIIVAFILSTAIGKWELVMTWSPRRNKEKSRL